MQKSLVGLVRFAVANLKIEPTRGQPFSFCQCLQHWEIRRSTAAKPVNSISNFFTDMH